MSLNQEITVTEPSHRLDIKNLEPSYRLETNNLELTSTSVIELDRTAGLDQTNLNMMTYTNDALP